MTTGRERAAADRRKRITRTAALTAAACVGAAAMVVASATGGLGAADSAAGADARAAQDSPEGIPGTGTVLQVVAHPDDDLYFMNPDIERSISAGHALTTVFLTAGESDGINGQAGETGRPPAPAGPAAADGAAGAAVPGGAGSGGAASGEAGTGDTGSGGAGAAEAASGKPGSGDMRSGAARSGEAAAGEAGSGDAGSGEAATGGAGTAAAGEAAPGDTGASRAAQPGASRAAQPGASVPAQAGGRAARTREGGRGAGIPRQAVAVRPAADKAAYAEARQNGIRAAYARMATGDRAARWTRTVIPTAGGGQAELDVLTAKPTVQLVWLQIREAGDPYRPKPESLTGLWDGATGSLGTQLSAGTPVTGTFSYTKDQVVSTLVGLLERFRPTLVRSQDPTPGRHPDTGRLTDHQDHMYGARFLQAALARYASDAGRRTHFTVQNYLGYLTGSLPGALAPELHRSKLDVLETYAWMDRQNYCHSPSGCGDLNVAARPGGNRWAETIRYARDNGTGWLVPGPGRSATAFAVLDGRMAVWRRPDSADANARWAGPSFLPGAGMDQGATAVRLPDGRIAVYGTRTVLGLTGADYRREVVTAVQTAPGGAFGEWRSLGSPEPDDAKWTSDISAPAVTLDASGRATVYVRDGAHTLRAAVQAPDGTWGPWEHLGGEGLQGNPAAAVDADGRSYVFVNTPATVLGWVWDGEAGRLTGPGATGLPATTLPLTAVPDGSGVRLWFRKPGSGTVRTAVASVVQKILALSPVTDVDGSAGGYGPVTAAGDVVAGRSSGGGLGASLGAGLPWQQAPVVLFDGSPSAAVGADRSVGVAAVGPDARLYWATASPGPGAALSPWRPVGPPNR
ncbi:PIG-L family deacetylase [Streptomyces sp. NPDC101132]|uniref:PIG-L family deacetylase n=1 Tax=Streptomyces sp. NPDC101132 TaxID=3366110 RepID=UPI00381F5747